ncbi:2'-5' RNA ligase family protein [Micromonospora aurantiaca (nom. illeg.)]|uniref:2'-5' RNA ligase family protein n=1 Tax=Micromonospora aurantiaca (nom. illeg.) TaxID=47850 RepID=UPI0033F7B8D8
MDSFFDRVTHRWPAGRRDYHWHILPPLQQARAALFEPYRELTHREGLIPVEPAWYHVTVLHSAPVQQVTDGELEQIVAGVRQRCAAEAPFDLTVDRPAVGSVAVECAARPGAPARRLWQATVEASTAVIGDRVPVLPAVYYPHMSLAYATDHVDHRPMKVWLSDHDIAPVTILVEHISLVAQSHNGRRITWHHILDVPLGG